MKTLKEMILRFPVISSVILLLLAAVFTDIHLEYLIQGYLGYQAAFYLTIGLEQCAFALLAGLLISDLGLVKNAGLVKPSPLRSVWLVWPIVVLAVINGFGLFDGTLRIDFSQPVTLVLFVFIATSTGLVEEIVCRGFVVTVLLHKYGRTKKGVYLTALLSSALFGLVHFTNVIMGRGTLLQVSIQVLYAVFFGVFFAACFLRQKSLWPAVVTHALFDLMGTLDEVSVGAAFSTEMSGNMTVAGALISLGITLPLFLYGLFLLRRVPEQLEAEAQAA